MAATESSTRAMAALDDLYRRHVGDVYRYTYAVLGNHADAEDVTQTTFVNALRALERGETPREASHWLLAIAHNLVRQRWRQAATRPTMVELVNDVPDEAPEDDVALDELVRALQRIPPSQREALVMRELEGRSYKEISELLGLSTSALETLLFRARRSLAEELENLVTCQTAEQSLSRQSDGRLSRKERKRLHAHIAECPSCARFARTQASQRKAFKGLAVLPVPVGLALFRDTPVAAAATLPTIGGTTTTGGAGTGGVAAGTSAAGGSVSVGGTLAGGSFLGAAAVKVAIAVVAATVVVGVGYQGVKTFRDGSTPDAKVTNDASVAAPATERAAPVPGAADDASLGSTGTDQTSPAEPSEIGGAIAPAQKGALPATPGDVGSTPGAGDSESGAKNSDSARGDGSAAGGEAPGAPAADDGSAAGGEAPGAPAAGAPTGGGATGSGETAGTVGAPASEPVAQPTQSTGASTAVPKPKSTPKSHAKPKKPKSKPPTAKGPKEGKPSTPPAGRGKSAEAPGKQKEPAAEPPATAPATESPPAASQPPASSETMPPAGPAPSADSGNEAQGWSPDNGSSAAAPGHTK